jgi:curved DNA-binding protein
MNHKEAKEILGFKDGDDVNPGVIKKAYRKLAKKFHPDANKGDKECEAKFKEINEANDTLSKPEESHIRFNHMGMSEDDIGNIFTNLFRHNNWNPHQNGGTRTMFQRIQIDPLMFINGGDINISVFGKDTKITLQPDTAVGTNIPVPNDNNVQLFFQLFPGDTQQYKVIGNVHIVQAFHINPFLAMLGGSIEVLTPKKKTIKIKLPAGTQSNVIHRIRGEGLNVGQGQHGDLHIQIIIDIPTITGSEEEILNKINKEAKNILHS